MKINESFIDKIVDKIVDRLKSGHLKKVKKSIDKEMGLSKAIEKFDKDYQELRDELVKMYGKEKLDKIDADVDSSVDKLNKELGIK